MSNGTKTLALLVLLLTGLADAVVAQRRGAERERARAVAEARRGWLGFAYMATEDGRMIVLRVTSGSPADEAGLEEGDTIVRWNGNDDPARAVAASPPSRGETIRLRVRRGSDGLRDLTMVAGDSRAVRVAQGQPGQVTVLAPGVRVAPRELRVHLDSLEIHADSLHTRLRAMIRDSLGPALRHFQEIEMPRIRAEMEAVREGMARIDRERLVAAQIDATRAASMAGAFAMGSRSVAGAEFAEVNRDLGSYFGTERGALTIRVADDTPAARAGLQAGDVIVSAGGRRVDDVGDLREAVMRSRDREVELEIVRRGARRELRLRWE